MSYPDEWKPNTETRWRRSVEVQKANLNLKKIVSKNIEQTTSTAKKPRPDLVDNFHWVIMRFRRQKKLTQEQFAKEIDEPLADVIRAEQGILPEKDYILVRKMENSLGIRLIKDATLKIENPTPEKLLPKVLKFEPNVTKELTIADLRRIKEERSSMRGQSKEERNSLDVSRIKERKEFDVSDFEDNLEDDGFEEEKKGNK